MPWVRRLSIGLCLLLGAASARAHEPEPTPENPELPFHDLVHRQGHFVREWIAQHEPDPPATPAEVDALWSRIQQAWAAAAQADDPLVTRLGPGGHARMLYELEPYDRTRPRADGLDCHVFSHYTVPIFHEYLERARREVHPKHADLLAFSIHSDYVAVHAVRCPLSPDLWPRLLEDYRSLPALLDRYLDAEAYADEITDERLRYAREVVERSLPYLELRDPLFRGERDETFAALAAALTRNDEPVYLRALLHELARRYRDAGEMDRARATLDLAARALSPAVLRHETLRSWYEEIDPEDGTERALEMRSQRAPVLEPHPEPTPEISGTYRNLMTDEDVDLGEVAHRARQEGKFLLLDFWTTWCTPCVAEIPDLQAFARRHSETLLLVAISNDPTYEDGLEMPALRRFVEERRVTYLNLVEEPARPLATRFGVSRYPSKYLIDPEGRLLHSTIRPGRRSITLDDLEAFFAGR